MTAAETGSSISLGPVTDRISIQDINHVSEVAAEFKAIMYTSTDNGNKTSKTCDLSRELRFYL